MQKPTSSKGISHILLILGISLLGAGAIFLSIRSSPKKQPTEIISTSRPEKPVEKTTPAQDNPMETKPVIYWSFDDENSINGTLNGVTFVKGKQNKAISFDGQDDYVEIDKESLNKIADLKIGTIAFWFKFGEKGPRDFNPILYIGKNQTKNVSSNFVVEIGHFDHGGPPDTKLYYTLYDDKQYEPFLCFDSNQNLETDTWYHFAVTNSNQGNTGYLNGAELTNRHYNFSNAKDPGFIADVPIKDMFTLGYGWFGIDQQFHYFKGALDELRIYDQVLTAEEISSLAE